MRKRIEVWIAESIEFAARFVVALLMEVLGRNPKARIGSATGGTMEAVYREMARCYAEGLMSLAECEVFQPDEYLMDNWPLPPQCYKAVLKTCLVDATDLPLRNLHVLNGATRDPDATCERWEKLIRERPIDLQLLGIGVEGHIAFNESRKDGGRTLRASRTRLVNLSPSTLRENGKFFPNGAPPHQALTCGIGTLLDVVQHFVLVAFGSKKSEAIASALLNPVADDTSPASFLREAEGKVTVIVDTEAAARLLTRLHKMGRIPDYLNVRVLDTEEGVQPNEKTATLDTPLPLPDRRISAQPLELAS